MLDVNGLINARRTSRMFEHNEESSPQINYSLIVKKRGKLPRRSHYLEVAGDEEALALASQKLNIEGDLTEKKFIAAGGLSIMRNGDKIFPK